jgi:hypothetical protein
MARRKKGGKKRGGNVVKKVGRGIKRVGKFAKDYAPLAGLMLMNAGVGYAAAKGMGKAVQAYENRQRQAEIRRANERDARDLMAGIALMRRTQQPNFTQTRGLRQRRRRVNPPNRGPRHPIRRAG